jgi:hypothetical protein
MDASDPRMVRKAGSKTWKKGGWVDVGLKKSDSEKAEARKGFPDPLRTLNDLGSTN